MSSIGLGFWTGWGADCTGGFVAGFGVVCEIPCTGPEGAGRVMPAVDTGTEEGTINNFDEH